mgnify:CR=1 FL=1|tara:strand:- start:1644 stop:3113 length:1470 start_codon:yes stop_codon:yes gene_type:complete
MANLDNCVFENNGVFFTGEENPGDNISQLTPQVYNGVTLPQGVYRRKIAPQPGFEVKAALLTIGGYTAYSNLGELPDSDGSSIYQQLPFWIIENYSSQTGDNAVPAGPMGNGNIAKVWMRDTLPGLPNNEVEVTIELIGDFIMPESPLVVSLDIDGDAIIYEEPFYTQEIAQDADTPFRVSFFPVFNWNPNGVSGAQIRVASQADLTNQVQTWGYNGGAPPDTLDGTSMLVTGVPIEYDQSLGGHADEVRYPTVEGYSFFHRGPYPVAPTSGSYMKFATTPNMANGIVTGTAMGQFGLLTSTPATQQQCCITLENYNSISGFTYNMYNTSIELSNLPESISWLFRMSYGTAGYDPATGIGGNPIAFVPEACSIYQVSAGLRSVSSTFSNGQSVYWAVSGTSNLINTLFSPLSTINATFEAHPDDNNKTMILTIPLQELFAFNQTSLEANLSEEGEEFVLESGGCIGYGIWVDIVTAPVDNETGEILYEG